MNKYKFRAECQADVDEFKYYLNGMFQNLESKILAKGFPDMEVTFESTEPLWILKANMLQITDGHVMVRSIAEASAYISSF